MIKFANGPKEDLEMFRHVNYDLKVQMLQVWVASNQHDVLRAFKITFNSSPSTFGAVRGAYFKPVIKFCSPARENLGICTWHLSATRDVTEMPLA